MGHWVEVPLLGAKVAAARGPGAFIARPEATEVTILEPVALVAIINLKVMDSEPIT